MNSVQYNTNSKTKPKLKRIIKKPNFYSILKYVFFILITIIIFLPILITLFTAFKTPAEFGSDFPLKPPSTLYVENFKTVFEKGHIFLGLKNSLILCVITVIINSILATSVSYCLTRFDFKFKKVILALFMIGMIIPTFVTEVTRFGVIKNLGLYNTIFAPIAIYAGADLMQIYIYMQFISKIPISIDESALIDGCSYFGVYRKIIFPMVLPAVGTMAILKIVDVMNDMYIPYLYMPSKNLRTLTTALMSFANSRTGSVVTLSAAVIVAMLPTVILYIGFQKYIFKGITAGAVKE